MQKKNTSQAQKKIFLRAEGNAYFKRNQGALAKLAAEAPHDPVVEALERSGAKPRSVLEIGCSTGWRLAYLQKNSARNVMELIPRAMPSGRA